MFAKTWLSFVSSLAVGNREENNPKNNLLEPNGPCDGEPT
jgi:hypothetical protein